MDGVVEAVYLDDWDAHVREKPIQADPETVEATIRQIAGRSCADLFFYPDDADVGRSGGGWLAVTASGAQFAVTAQLGEGEWAHLVVMLMPKVSPSSRTGATGDVATPVLGEH
jgi:hypothetical protein